MKTLFVYKLISMYNHLKCKKVLVAMSGGVDSSMVAIMLKKAGIDVIGVTFKLGDTKINLGSSLDSSCCTIDDVNDARMVAVKYGFPHYVIDLKSVFEKNVIDDFVDRSLAGETPNPCVVCNKTVKWASMMRYANAFGCVGIATGHYARVLNKDGRFYLSRPKDSIKDQTYFLYNLSQDDLSKTVFPLGDYLKSEVKQMSIDEGLNTFLEKKESFDICFIGDSTYKEFILAKYPDLKNLAGGNIELKNGTVLGEHGGYPFYTIGQRKGLGVSYPKPLYIIDIDAANNRLIVGPIEDLAIKTAYINSLNLMKTNEIVDGTDCVVKVRSLDKGTNAKIYSEGDRVRIDFLSDVKGGVAVGQSAVVYDGNDILFGGTIIKHI